MVRPTGCSPKAREAGTGDCVLPKPKLDQTPDEFRPSGLDPMPTGQVTEAVMIGLRGQMEAQPSLI